MMFVVKSAVLLGIRCVLKLAKGIQHFVLAAAIMRYVVDFSVVVRGMILKRALNVEASHIKAVQSGGCLNALP
jgi:hypothetical protein